MVEGAETKSAVFIVESVDLDDERLGYREGRILRDLLRLSGKPSAYWYIRTKKEFKEILPIFGNSAMRYLHISSHGSTDALHLTFDRLPFDNLVGMLRPYLAERRLFVSACDAVNRNLASGIMPRSRCLSIIGPKGRIFFGDAAVMWASFYHLMFREEATVMARAKILNALGMISNIFGIPIRYFGRQKDGVSFSDQTIGSEGLP